jgi:hypothetical protein
LDGPGVFELFHLGLRQSETNGVAANSELHLSGISSE